jgi:hypothetical protein
MRHMWDMMVRHSGVRTGQARRLYATHQQVLDQAFTGHRLPVIGSSIILDVLQC